MCARSQTLIYLLFNLLHNSLFIYQTDAEVSSRLFLFSTTGDKHLKLLLSNVLGSLISERQTGQLAITIRGAGHHCKIYFREGDIYHIVCGKQIASECLDSLIAGDLAECFFIPNLRTGSTQKPALTSDQIIGKLNEHGVMVEFKTMSGIVPNNSASPSHDKISPAAGKPVDFQRIQEGIKMALIRQIGPVGARIMARAIEQKWRVLSPTKEDVLELIRILKYEIDDYESQNEFLAETRKLF